MKPLNSQGTFWWPLDIRSFEQLGYTVDMVITCITISTAVDVLLFYSNSTLSTLPFL